MASRQNKQRISSSAKFIFESLKTDIALGRFHPRERLIEKELVERFKSHRPAVREALSLLTQIGLIVHVPNKGVSVAELSLEELTKIYEMRIELEDLAARWIPLPLSQDAIGKLEDIQKDHGEAVANRRFREIFRLDMLFHSTLNSHCGNHHLEEMIDLMSTRGLLARYSAMMDAQFLAEVRDEHVAIIDAIKAADRDRLVAVMHAHNVRGIDWFSARIREQSEHQKAPNTGNAG